MTWAVVRRATPQEEKRVAELGLAFEKEHGIRPGAALHTREGDLWTDEGTPVPPAVQRRLCRAGRALLKEEFGVDADGLAYGAFGYESRAG